MTEIENYKESIISILKSSIADIAVIYIFGSFAQSTAKSSSDIDIAFYSLALKDKAELKKETFRLKSEMSQKLNKEIDLINMSIASPILNFQIFQNGQIIYKSNDDKLKSGFENFKVNKLNEYYDFKIERREAEEALKHKRVI